MKPIYERAKMTLTNGNNLVEKRMNIPHGKRVYARVVALPSPDVILDVALYENGQEIHPAMDISNYDGGIGSFEQRALELPYTGGTELTVQATTTKNVTADVEIEVIFLIYTEEKC